MLPPLLLSPKPESRGLMEVGALRSSLTSLRVMSTDGFTGVVRPCGCGGRVRFV